jgi:hypothetical protein
MARKPTRRNRRRFRGTHYVSAISQVTLSFRGDAQHRTRNLEIPGLVLTHHPGMTSSHHGISYTTILSAMPRNAACFWIGLIASRSRIVTTAGESITGPVM